LVTLSSKQLREKLSDIKQTLATLEENISEFHKRQVQYLVLIKQVDKETLDDKLARTTVSSGLIIS